MTFDELVAQIAADLNLTAPTAIARIGRHVNMKYRELVALPWLQISRRGVAVQPITVGNRYVAFMASKIYSVFDPAREGMTLGERTFDELRNQIVRSDPPNEYAIAGETSRTLTIFLDCLPASVYSLSADVEQRTVTLSGDQEPKFGENFHDILYYGGKYLELLKMEKGELATEANRQWEKRLSDLKYHIAKTGYLDYVQGKDTQSLPAFVNTIVS